MLVIGIAGGTRAGDQVEVGNMSRRKAPGQIGFQLFIAQKGFKGHGFSSQLVSQNLQRGLLDFGVAAGVLGRCGSDFSQQNQVVAGILHGELPNLFQL